MTTQEVIQRVRDLHALRAGVSFEDARAELVVLSARLADDAERLKDENDALKAKVEQLREEWYRDGKLFDAAQLAAILRGVL